MPRILVDGQYLLCNSVPLYMWSTTLRVIVLLPCRLRTWTDECPSQWSQAWPMSCLRIPGSFGFLACSASFSTRAKHDSKKLNFSAASTLATRSVASNCSMLPSFLRLDGGTGGNIIAHVLCDAAHTSCLLCTCLCLHLFACQGPASVSQLFGHRRLAITLRISTSFALASAWEPPDHSYSWNQLDRRTGSQWSKKKAASQKHAHQSL